jgi:hypothetical protein
MAAHTQNLIRKSILLSFSGKLRPYRAAFFIHGNSASRSQLQYAWRNDVLTHASKALKRIPACWRVFFSERCLAALQAAVTEGESLLLEVP